MRTLCVILLLAACSSSPTPSKGPGNTPPPTTAGDTSCATDADCVVVETQCCDHCNGGKAVAFNKAHADAHKATGCEGTMCTEMACGQAVASCQAGVCTATIAPLAP